MDLCTEVQQCEVLLFPCVPLAGNAHMMPCLVAWRNNCANGLALDSVLFSQGYLCDVLLRECLNRVRQNRLHSRTTLITPRALRNEIVTQCCWIAQQLPLSH